MAHGKDPSPLFEIIHRSPKSSRRGVRVPEWMRQAEEMEKHVEAAEPTVAPGQRGPRWWTGWWSRPVRFRLQAGVLLMCGLAVLLLVLVSLFVGVEYQKRRAATLAYKLGQEEREIGPLQEKDPNPGLIPRNITRNTVAPDATPAPPKQSGATGNADDPRQPGLNYFRLIELPQAAREEGAKAVEFLKENGVDAGLVSVNNGRSYKLLALRGFDRVGSPEAQAYGEKLKQLGRMWKAKFKAVSSDWHDLYPEKYVPGRT